VVLGWGLAFVLSFGCTVVFSIATFTFVFKPLFSCNTKNGCAVGKTNAKKDGRNHIAVGSVDWVGANNSAIAYLFFKKLSKQVSI
jgi:hypothetical protein